jgi:hypothetical protein
MTNAFNWKQYTDEERAKCSEKGDRNTALKRSVASTKAIERSRLGTTNYGTVGVGAKTAAMVAQKPVNFNVFK